MEHWRQVVFSRLEIRWHVGNKYGETRRWQVSHRWWYGLWHRHRIELFSKITQGEWSIAKDIEPFFRRCNARHRQAFYDLGNVYVFDIGSICIHGKELLRQVTFHQKYRGKSHFKADVRHIWKVWYWNNQIRFLECLKSAGKTLHGNISLWSIMKKSSVSRMQRKVYVFSDSVLCLGQVNQNTTSNTVCEQQLDWFKESPQYRTLDTIDGEPMEFEWNIFPGFTTLQLLQEVQKFMNKMSDPDQFQGRIIFMSMFNDIIWELMTMIRNVLLMSHLCLCFFLKASSRTLVIPRTWIGNKVIFYLQRKTTRRMGQRRWIDDDQIQRKRTPSFSSHESIVSRNAQKQRRWTIIDTLLCRWGYDWNCFRISISVNQLSIYGAVSDVCQEYSTCQTRTGRPVLAGQSDPLFEPAKLLIMTPRLSIEIPAQENYCKSTRNDWKGFHNKIEW